VIGISPIGPVETSAISWLVPALNNAFRVEVVVAPAVLLPDRAWNPHRRQHYSTAILDELAGARRPEWERLLGICNVDLYVPDLNFVFGEADPFRRVAVFSLWRLRPTEEGTEVSDRFELRAATEAIHELGHTYGLGHCENRHCVMWFSNTLAESDRKGTAFCSAHAAALSRAR